MSSHNRYTVHMNILTYITLTVTVNKTLSNVPIPGCMNWCLSILYWKIHFSFINTQP